MSESETGAPAKPGRVKLTNTLAERHPAPAKGQSFVRDTEVMGFALRVTAAGARTWVVEAWHAGRSFRRGIGPVSVMSADVARKRARQVLSELHSGVDSAAEARERVEAVRRDRRALGDALADYAKRARLSERTRADYVGLAAFELAPWCSGMLQSLDPDMARRMHAEITREHGPARADYALRLVRATCYAEGVGNPCAKVKGSSFPWNRAKPRAARLDPSHAPKLWAALGEQGGRDAAAFLRLLMLSGLRRGEAAALRVGDVDLAHRALRLPTTKNGRSHVVYLSQPLVRELAPRVEGRKAAELLFEGCADPRRSIAAASEVLGVHFSPHDLRKLFARVATEQQVSYSTLMRLLNHTVQARDVTASAYAQPSEREQRFAVERIAAAMVEPEVPVLRLVG